MRRLELAALVVAADAALQAAVWGGRAPIWGLSAYVLASALVLVVSHRYPLAGFVAALALAAAGGGSFVLLLWVCYQAGRAVISRRGMGVTVVALAGFLAAHAHDPGLAVAVSSVFIALPWLLGRYFAQHQLLVDQERLRERLRIASHT